MYIFRQWDDTTSPTTSWTTIIQNTCTLQFWLCAAFAVTAFHNKWTSSKMKLTMEVKEQMQ